MTTITHLVLNDIAHDSRIRKEVDSALRKGYEVNVLCFNPSNMSIENANIVDIELRKIERIKRNKVGKETQETKAKLITKKDIFRTGKIFAYTLQILLKSKGINQEIIHANDLTTFPAGYILSILKKSKLVYDSHEIYSEQFVDSSTIFKHFLKFVEGIFIQRAQVIIVNEPIADWFELTYKIKRPTVVMNTPIKKNASILKKEGKLKGIYIGGLSKGRGIEELVSSASKWKNAELFIQGEGPIKEYLKEISGNNVHFLDYVDTLSTKDSILKYDFGVIPYKATYLNNFYCMPNKLFEYMSAGLALVVSDLPELRRIAVDNSIGVVINPDNVDNISETVNKLTREATTSMGKRALKCVNERYNWDVGSKRLIEVYKKIGSDI